MNKILRDEVSTILLTSKDLRDYVVKIICSATGLDEAQVSNNLELDETRINTNIETKYSEVDVIYTNDLVYFNIEINTSKSNRTETKNIRYVCHLALRQILPGMKDKIKRIYQIL